MFKKLHYYTLSVLILTSLSSFAQDCRLDYYGIVRGAAGVHGGDDATVDIERNTVVISPDGTESLAFVGQTITNCLSVESKLTQVALNPRAGTTGITGGTFKVFAGTDINATPLYSVPAGLTGGSEQITFTPNVSIAANAVITVGVDVAGQSGELHFRGYQSSEAGTNNAVAPGSYSSGTSISNLVMVDGTDDDLLDPTTTDLFFDVSFSPEVLSVGSIEDTGISIYPNPFKNELSLNIETGSIVNIYSVDGTLLKTVVSSASTEVLDTNSLVSGIYFLEITTNGKRTVNKVVKM